MNEYALRLRIKGIDSQYRHLHKELRVFNIQDYIAENKDRSISHLNGMPDGRFPKEVWQPKLKDVQESLCDADLIPLG